MSNVRLIPVTALNQETAASCIFKYLGRQAENKEEFDLACQLADHVGGLPLAMATIAGYVKESQISLADFFQNITHKATLWERALRVSTTVEYERSLVTVFEKAFDDLTPPARELLNTLAFLDPDQVPEEIFTTAIDNNLFSNIKTRCDLYDCYFEIQSRQLIQRDTSSKDISVSIQRIIQWHVLLDLSSDHEKHWVCFKRVLEIVKAILPTQDSKPIPRADAWPPYAKYGRQILELRTHCLWSELQLELPISFAQTLADMGTYMWFSGKFKEGGRALQTAETILDDNHVRWNIELRANIQEMIGIITSYEGVSERARSMEFRKSAYETRRHGEIGRKPEERWTRDEAMMYWNMHSDMAFGFIQQEDFESTARCMDDCWHQYQKWSKDEMQIPFEYSKYYQLIAFCHMGNQNPGEAIEAINRCYELMQEAAGNDHPMTQLIRFCYGNLLWHSGGSEARRQSLQINKEVLESRQKLLGEFSQFTLES